jgi:hypothetical protein
MKTCIPLVIRETTSSGLSARSLTVCRRPSGQDAGHESAGGTEGEPLVIEAEQVEDRSLEAERRHDNGDHGEQDAAVPHVTLPVKA